MPSELLTKVQAAWSDDRKAVADIVSKYLWREHDNLGMHDSDDQISLAFKVGILVGKARNPMNLMFDLETFIKEESE